MGANAQTAVPAFTAGQVLTAAQQTQINTGIPVFATTVTRDAAFGGAGEKTLAEGQFAYIEATNTTQYYDGAAWQSLGATYTAYTPTYTNLTIGNGTNNFRYAQVGSLVHAYGQLTFGSTTSMGSQPKISLPVTAKLANDFYTNNISYIDASTTDQFFGAGYVDTTTTVRFKLPQVTGVNIFHANVGASAPFTWTTSDVINFNFVYEAA
jgi:hypothetical protein